MFEKLSKRVFIKGNIKATTAIHIGSGAEASEPGVMDMPIIRDSNNKPYIPGSSFKGKFRSETEKIAKSVGKDICKPPKSTDMCPRYNENFCAVCRIFGSPGLNSKIKIRDMHPTTELEEKELDRRPGVSINRETGTAQRGAVFWCEAIPTGTEFSFEFTLENIEQEEWDLIVSSLKSLKDTFLGGLSSRGMGKVDIIPEQVIVKTAKCYTGEEEPRVENVKSLEDLQNIKI